MHSLKFSSPFLRVFHVLSAQSALSFKMQILSWCKSFLRVFHLLRIFFMNLIATNFIPSPRLNNKIDVWLAFCSFLLQLYVYVIFLYNTFFSKWMFQIWNFDCNIRTCICLTNFLETYNFDIYLTICIVH